MTCFVVYLRLCLLHFETCKGPDFSKALEELKVSVIYFKP